MGESIDAVFAAPIANILVVAGIVFLLVAVLGSVAGKIDPGKGGRIAAGAIGLVLLVVGLSMHLVVSKNSDSDNGGADEVTTQQFGVDETRQQALEEARREAAEQVRQQALEEARREAAEQARQQTLAEARREAAEQARQQTLAEARREAAEQVRQQALEEARREAAEQARQQILAEARRKAADARSLNPCEPINIPDDATCNDFYADRNNWKIGKIRSCGLYQVRRYKEALNIRSKSEWGSFLSSCK